MSLSTAINTIKDLSAQVQNLLAELTALRGTSYPVTADAMADAKAEIEAARLVVEVLSKRMVDQTRMCCCA